MSINKKLLIISISFIILIFIASLTVIMTSDYNNNKVSIDNAALLEEKLLKDLELDQRLYLFTPKFVVENKLEDLGYIKDYSVERIFPNLINIYVELDEVLWCDESFLYYAKSKIEKDKLNEYCVNKPIAIGMPDNDVKNISMDYINIKNEIKDLILEVIYIDEHTISFKMSDGITVYMTLNEEKTITSQLNNYFNYKVTNNVLDLRQKYC